MPKKSKKEIEIKKKSTRRSAQKPLAPKIEKNEWREVGGEQAENKKFIVINEYDPQMETRKIWLWLIVGGFSFCLVIFWIWSLSWNLKSFNNENRDGLTQKIGETIGELKDNFSNLKDNLGEITDEAKQTAELARVQEEVISRIKENLAASSADWPSHTSEVMKLSVQYPNDWTKQEKNKIIALSSIATSPAAKITIAKIDNAQNITLEQWFNLSSAYGPAYQAMPAITTGGLPAIKYVKADPAGDINWLILVDGAKTIYKIDIVSVGGADLYEPILEQIIKTIKFL